ncbi:MAG: 4'-phosphopantetheinyl transferase superfamily protein [Myxococcota bacterium]|nr:4'-phosphopantetheinyl transferase superfamily protein [Myxococcota bacterium]
MSNSESLPLAPGCVVVRYMPSEPASPERAEENLSLLSVEERQRHGRRTPSARAEFCSAHALLRRTLSLYADLEPADWRFSPDAMGKPGIVNPPWDRSLHFNLSHTRGLVACVVARDMGVGIDVETPRRSRDYSQLAERVLSASERARWKELPPSQQPAGFLDYWTLKEAHLKATGTGIRSALDRLEFRLEGADRAHCRAEAGPGGREPACHYLRLRPTENHHVAVACTQAAPPRWDVSGLDP